VARGTSCGANLGLPSEPVFTDEERDIEVRQAEVDTAQALLDRHRPNSTG